jgi:hypothetical protein
MRHTPDLTFRVQGAEPQRFNAAPLMLFRLAITETPPTPIHAIALHCQLRIEPGRRRYTAVEQQRLLDLFGTPERWGQTLRPMLWTHADVAVPAFTGSTQVDLPVPCSFDFSLAATKYFDALEGGDLALCFLFSGTIFFEAEDGTWQVTQVPWDKEAYFRLEAATWKSLMDTYYPNGAWLRLRKDVFDRLSEYKSRRGVPTWEEAIEELLAEADAPYAGNQAGREAAP